MRSIPPAVAALLLITLAHGSAWAQNLACTPSTFSFGNVQVGQSSTGQIQITNTGSPSATITYKSSGTSGFSFGSVALPVFLGPGSSVQLPVTFTPMTEGVASAVMGIISDALNPILTFTVSGMGVASSTPQLGITPLTLNFGNVSVGSSASLKATFTALNAPVTISSSQSSNSEFAVVGLKLPMTIPSGSSAQVTLQFTPTAATAASGKANFTSNAANSQAALPLTGTGVAVKPTPHLAVNPPSLTFGNVQVGSYASMKATLTASNGTVTISSKKSANADFYILGLTVPAKIAAGASLPVTIRFAPKAAGARSGKADFLSTATDSALVLPLAGTGITNQPKPQLSVSPATLSFGSVTVGSSTSLPATIAASNGPVTISSDQSTSSEFSIHGLIFPVTIAAGKSVTATIQFTPNASGVALAKAGFISNALNTPTIEQLTGTGVARAAHVVDLSWTAGASGVTGYNVYRGTVQTGPFKKINTVLDATPSYADSTVLGGQTYYYAATEISSKGVESHFSNVTKAVVPSP